MISLGGRKHDPIYVVDGSKRCTIAMFSKI
jgi:hypothetical protein